MSVADKQPKTQYYIFSIGPASEAGEVAINYDTFGTIQECTAGLKKVINDPKVQSFIAVEGRVLPVKSNLSMFKVGETEIPLKEDTSEYMPGFVVKEIENE